MRILWVLRFHYDLVLTSIEAGGGSWYNRAELYISVQASPQCPSFTSV